jgi:hypothetical protein
MRAATLSLHSSQQRAGIVTGQKHARFTGFCKYVAEQRELHGVLRARFPVRTVTNFQEALDTDLFFLELEAWHADLPMLTPQPYVSEYAAFLETLPKERLGCHWYNLVFAHLVGGNRAIAASAAPVLPKGWLDSSEFFTRVKDDDVLTLRDAFETEAQSWSPEQREVCLAETEDAFRRATRVNELLYL